jgi:hypothetical protein
MTKSPPASLSAATLIRKGEPIGPSTLSPPEPEAAPQPALPPRVGTIAVTLRLDPDRYENLKAAAARMRRTNQDILRDALDAYLRKEGSN